MHGVPSSAPLLTADHDGNGTISAVYHDVLRTHILTRLDGPTLATVSCSSSELHSLSSDDKLWQDICTSTWPSINDPLISSVISTFPSAHRSFFSDAYPLLHHHRHSSKNLRTPPFPETTELISAVDIYYRNVPIFSRVEKTETVSGWFLCSPFRIELLEPKEIAHTCIRKVGKKESWLKHLEENVTLSWILIDPKDRRAVNMSSRRAVSVQRHWLTGELQVKYSVVLAGQTATGSEKEYVESEVVVTCGVREGGVVHVMNVSMGMGDLEGKGLTGEESLVMLKRAMESGERRKEKGDGKEGKERYEEFMERKRKRKEGKERRERVLDWVCIGSGVACFVSFWALMLFR